MGVFDAYAGKFHLVIAFDYDPALKLPPGEVDRWKEAFVRASEMLYDATDGQHQLGSLYVCPYGTGKDVADVWLLKSAGGSSSDGRIWIPGSHILLANDEQNRPFVILHELGHYLYALRDEYKDTNGNEAHCLGRDAGGSLPGACIMEGGFQDGDRFGVNGTGGPLELGDVTDFCVDCNHDKGGATTCAGGAAATSFDDVADDTVQSATHGKSCWETMAGYYPDLVEPGALPDPGPADGPDPVNWVELVGEPRFVFALDGSEACFEAAPRVWAGAKYGILQWLDMAWEDDRMGVVAYNHDVESTGLLPNTPRAQAHLRSFVRQITPGGTTNLYGGLIAAADMFRSAGRQSTTQVLIVVSGSTHDTGPEPLLLLPMLRERGIRVYGIATSPGADLARLAALAHGTGGRVLRLSLFPPFFDRGPSRIISQTLRERLLHIFAETHEEGGVITVGAAPPSAWDPSLPGLPDGGDSESAVLVEEGCEAVTFALGWEGGGEARFDLLAPDKRRITAMTDHANVRRGAHEQGLALYGIRHPRPGEWRARAAVGATDVDSSPGGQLYAIARSPRVRLRVSTTRGIYVEGEEVRVVAQVTAPLPVTGLDLAGTVRGPEDETTKLEFEAEEGSGIHAAKFRAAEPGLYAVTVVADNAAGEARIAPGVDEAPRPPAGEEPPRVPAFKRRAELQVHVTGRLQGQSQAEPRTFGQGTKSVVRVEFGGHLWIPGTCTLHAGPGIRFRERLERKHEDGAAWFDIEVARHAAPGERDGIIRFADATQVLKGFIRVEGEPVAAKTARVRQTHPGRFLRELLAERPSNAPRHVGRHRY